MRGRAVGLPAFGADADVLVLFALVIFGGSVFHGTWVAGSDAQSALRFTENTVPKFVPTPPPKWPRSMLPGPKPEIADQARIYCSNSLNRRQCQNAPMNLLTGGLLVRVQPEEPIPFRQFPQGSDESVRFESGRLTTRVSREMAV